jgi:acyl-CoA synthetase (AMP-forming)/AMP-acid ligase II
LKNNNVTSRFFETALLFPNKTALQYDNESVTFHQLSEKVNLLCSQFLNKGIKSGDKILVLHPLSIDLYASLLALLKLNCCLVFVEEWTKLSDIIACQKQINCQYIICSKKVNFIRLFIPSLQRLERISLKHTAQYPIIDIEIPWKSEAILSFSSGSSGQSKVIIRTHQILNAQFDALKDKIIDCENAKMISNFPVVILLNLGLGISSYLSKSIKMSKLNKTDFRLLYNEIIREKITHLSVSPYIINQLANTIKTESLNKINLFQIISGGAPFFPSFVENINQYLVTQYFFVLYGSSEAEPIAQCSANEIVENTNNQGLYAGEIDENCQCIVGDVSNGIITEFEPYKAGEIFVSGEHVVKNYLNDNDLELKNKIKFKDRIWHRTGDFGYFDSANKLFLTGDINRKQGSQYLLDIEKSLQKIKGVERATLLNNIVYVQTQINEDKRGIEKEIQLIFNTKIKIIFMKLPLDRRHFGKIKYKELEQSKQ